MRADPSTASDPRGVFTADNGRNVHSAGSQGLQAAVFIEHARRSLEDKKYRDDNKFDLNVFAAVLFPNIKDPADAAGQLKALFDTSGHDFGTFVASFQERDINFGAMYEAKHSNPKYLELPADGRTGDQKFDSVIQTILDLEGGYNPNEPGGHIAKFGINSKYHPEVNQSGFTVGDAIGIYKEDYWDSIPQLKDMHAANALLIFDTAVNCGPSRARDFLSKCTVNGQFDKDKFFGLREEHYARLIAKNPAKYGQYEQGWDNRLKALEADYNKLVAQSQAKEQKLSANFNNQNLIPTAPSANDPNYGQENPALTPSLNNTLTA